MKKVLLALAVVACMAIATPCYGNNVNRAALKGDRAKLDTLSYAFGANSGYGIKAESQFGDLKLNLDVVSDAAVDALVGKAGQTQEEAQEILWEFFSKTMRDRYMAHKEVLKTDSTAVFKAFENDAECKKISRALGIDVGSNVLNAKHLEVQYYWFIKGFDEACNDKAELTQEQTFEFLNRYAAKKAAEAAERSLEWLAKKAAEEGVKKTESGLLYKVIVTGDMSKAAKSDEDVVKVHYIGRKQDGTVFDASRFEYRPKAQQEMMRQQMPTLFDENGNIKENKPIEFPLNRVIKGWTEGMKLVGPGGKIMLYIPAELAYGERGAADVVGPNEALEFEVELLEVTPAAPATPAEVPAEAPAEESFVKVEKMPSFKGGDLMTFRNWVMSQIRYPQIAQENNISGRVMVSFVIERNGKVSNIQILQSPHASLSDEVVRVLKMSPKWKPGIQDGKAVRVRYTLPVEFRVQN